MDRAHIRNGQIIKMFGGPSGYLVNEDGRRTDVSKIDIGWQLGNDRLVAVVEETQDTSTGADIVRTDTGYQIEADRVYRLITIRDMTAQEIADRVEQEIAENDRELTEMRVLRALATGMWHIHNRSVPAQVNTPARFREWLKSLMRE